jgi:hypothetical protein
VRCWAYSGDCGSGAAAVRVARRPTATRDLNCMMNEQDVQKECCCGL